MKPRSTSDRGPPVPPAASSVAAHGPSSDHQATSTIGPPTRKESLVSQIASKFQEQARWTLSPFGLGVDFHRVQHMSLRQSSATQKSERWKRGTSFCCS